MLEVEVTGKQSGETEHFTTESTARRKASMAKKQLSRLKNKQLVENKDPDEI